MPFVVVGRRVVNCSVLWAALVGRGLGLVVLLFIGEIT